MRYKIVEKNSGRCDVYREDSELIGSGKYWEYLFESSSYQLAKKAIDRLNNEMSSAEVMREEIIDV